METPFLFDNVSDPIVVLDRNFCVLRANPSFWRIFGISPQHALGKRSCDLFRELSYSQCNDACSRVFEKALEGKKIAVPNDRCPHFVCALPMLDLEGKLDKMMLLLKDVPYRGGEERAIVTVRRKDRREINGCTDGREVELGNQKNLDVWKIFDSEKECEQRQ